MVEPFEDLELKISRGEHYEVDAPVSRRSRRGPGAWLESMGARSAIALGLKLPGPMQNAWIKTLAGIARGADRRHSCAAREFIRTALPAAPPERVEELVACAWRHLPRVAIESASMGRLVGQRLGDHFDVEACEGLDEVLAAEQGALVITAHVGIWEALGIPLSSMGLSPFYAVGKSPRNAYLGEHMDRQRTLSGGVMIPRRGAMQAVPKVVRAGGAVMMLLDHRARQRPIIAPFFGRPAACDRSAGVLVRRVQAPLVFVACYLQEGPRPYRLVFSRVVFPDDLKGLDAAQVMELVNRESERLILACPEQYFWLHDRYKDLPLVS